MKSFTLYIYFLAIFCCTVENPAAQSQTLKTVKDKEGILVKEGDQKVLFYQKTPKSINGGYTRNNYIHPLYGLGGKVLTEDFPEDHYHHRGIFWAWHQVIVDGEEMGDMWETEDFTWDVKSVETMISEKKAIVEPVVHWKSSDMKDASGNKIPFVKESTSIATHPSRDGMRMIYFTIRLRALKDDVYIGGSDNEKGYGGFSPRIILPDDIEFTADYGDVEPETTAVPASPWMDFTGSFTDKNNQSGILILCHPSNPGFPPGWIIRNEGSMQNPVYPGREPVRVPQSEQTILRYRMIIHKNELNKNAIQQLFSNYAQQE